MVRDKGTGGGKAILSLFLYVKAEESLWLAVKRPEFYRHHEEGFKSEKERVKSIHGESNRIQ